MLSVLKNRKVLALLIQAAVVATVGLLSVSFVLIAARNLSDQGIATGLTFLGRSTGWPINFSLTGVTERSTYSAILFAGFLNTLLVGAVALAGASLIGIAVGLMRISTNAVLNLLGTVYVEIFRNVPLILQGFFWYAILTHLPSPRAAIPLGNFGFLSNRGLMLPALDISAADLATLAVGTILIAWGAVRARAAVEWPAGRVLAAALAAVLVLFTILLLAGRTPDAPLITYPELAGLRFVGGFTLKPEFSALVIAISVFGGAYIGEIVRGGFLSVGAGRIEAAASLGMKAWQIHLLVRIPLALRAVLPAVSNQYVWLMKATTIGIAIGFPDYFMVVSTAINQQGQTIELLALLMGGFLAINYTLGSVLNLINARLALPGQGRGR